MSVDLIAWIIFALICVFCAFCLIKQRGFHPEAFELLEGEEILKMAKGDFWTQEDSNEPGDIQNAGEFMFTNKRILFKGMYLVSNDRSASIPYEEIAKIENSVVGYILPVAFIITIKNNEKYKFAIMKRQEYIDLINSNLKKLTLIN